MSEQPLDLEHVLGTGMFFGHFMHLSNVIITPLVDDEGVPTSRAWVHFMSPNRPGSRFLIEVIEADLTVDTRD